jgi:hypothetical protein
MENGGSLSARIAALESDVAYIGQTLGWIVGALGALNAHVGASLEQYAEDGDLTAMQERLEDLNTQIQNTYNELDERWPAP